MVTGTLRFIVLVAGALPLMLPAPLQAEAFVAGDSLGQGIAAAAGLPNRARLSVRLAQDAVIAQISALPRGAVAYLSLGTNDAVGPVGRLAPSVERILRTARERRLRLVWIGPPCMLSRRVPNVAALDAVLRERVRGEGVTYVSAVEGSHCSAEMRARDGIHFTARDYRALWELARATAEAPSGAADGRGPQEAAEELRAREPPAEQAAAAAARPAAAGPVPLPPERPVQYPRRLTPVVLTVPAPRPLPPAEPVRDLPSFRPHSRS